MPLVSRSFPLTYGTGMLESINELMALHGGWTRIEDVVSGTQTATVWRSPAIAGKPQFHIAFYRAAVAGNATGVISYFLFEGWNTDTKSFSRPAPAAASGDVATPAADGSYGGGTEYPLLTTTTAFNPILFRPTISTSTAVSLTISVTRWGVILSLNPVTVGSTNSGLYSTIWLGAIDSFATVNDPVAIGIFDRPSTALTASRWTRYPTVVSPQPGNWGGLLNRWTLTAGSLNGPQDRLWGSVLGSRLIAGNSGAAGQASSHGGWQRGFLPGMLEFNGEVGAPLNIGDTLQVGTATYEVVGTDFYRGVWAYDRAAG